MVGNTQHNVKERKNMHSHGGDIYSYAERTGSSVIYDFSANINPFGISDEVRKAIAGSVDKISNYPDPQNRELTAAINKYHGISESYIVCGNGGADIIYRTVMAVRPEKSLVIAPTFTEYYEALSQNCKNLVTYSLPHPFVIDEGFTDEIGINNYDLIVLCNPNNPTGTLTEKDMICRIAETAKKKNTKVILDECFFDMTELNSEKNSMISLCEQYPNLIIIKSMTKMYALPGIRLGYGICSDKEMTEKIRKCGQPWPVNIPASEAGIAALKDVGYRKEFIEYIEEERMFMYSELRKLGFEVWKPSANFVFFRAPGIGNLDTRLAKYGLMIRHCDNYPGLNEEYYRICVRMRNENLFLLRCLEKIVNEEKHEKKSAKSLMVTGTMSNSGKSFVTAGLCRIFMQDGHKTAPFKAQNMALNSYITKDGLEMGRAQVMQAEAAGIEPDVRMNPVLLKPTSDKGSQVIVCGEVLETMDAKKYYSRKQDMIPHVMNAYNSLADENEIIVLEGAGSPAEINLKDADIVNMGMAKMSGSPVILVGDIDRGGVFASVYGTWALMDDYEKKMLKGIIINKFRGDVSILEPGLKMLEELTGLPVLGVIPYTEIDIDDEDSLSERLKRNSVKSGSLADIAVIKLPRISNFTDFDVFSRIDRVSLRYISDVREFGNPDMIIIPGTKSTMSDLQWMRQNGIEAKILQHQKKGGLVAGICGGYQMLGKKLCDPENIESGGEMRGMELLDVTTVFKPYKHRSRVTGEICSDKISEISGGKCSGYEIHMGQTSGAATPFVRLENGEINGHINSDGTVFGTYLHGFFDAYDIAGKIISALAGKKGENTDFINEFDPVKYKEMQYDKLADCIRKNTDIEKIYEIIERGI